MSTNKECKCSVCMSEFDEEEGVINGYFGILPVSFCLTCYTCMVDMVLTDLGEEK